MANNRLSDLIHILVYIELHDNQKLTSELIASSLNTNPSLTRRMMGQLRKANLLETTQGAACPKLAKNPNKITIFDVYMATCPDSPLLKVDQNTSKECQVGHIIPTILNKYYLEIQSTAEAKMRRITIADIADDVRMDIAHHQKNSDTFAKI
ncbi:Rrf2 family transcriptional regulator [Liquorilactobacillus mali]|uniref:Transcription regulator n=2 Tax=Liquorilactobacillus mali TaxID=1618 RepID=J0L3F8_9LACO|nr:Rrf2 family transcriptional regulator [Liquorilactobacillus mali]EJE97543.1 Rrf2 family transcriptional regulator [Liquorilactobacillus mali KCTC 3596 = DSM 20444]KRN11213.1 transcription regulator [Liquorilactobacillus mali KCTC 3596 = DSM 20444]KRN27383.1 transcription regulator [Liquorilactobacillus mali]MDN7146322.1 Rrf2 family transcriptional regulator [Liquorilactobacillus mali]QFQ73794.1 Rrf2 family transcriptional regulator [Liquorilactobacillus mali]